MLITGRRTPKTGRAGRQAVAKVVIRALVLLVLGTALTMTDTPVEVILAFYGVYFLLALPLHRLAARPLAITAAAGALILTQVLTSPTAPSPPPNPAASGPGRRTPTVSCPCSSPAATRPWPGCPSSSPEWRSPASTSRPPPYAYAWRSPVPPWPVVGHGGSFLALHLVPGALKALDASAWGGAGSASSAWWSDTWGYPSGATPAELLVASPHSETTLSILGNTGVALAVLVGCLTAVDVFPRFHRLTRPVIAVGSMSLTAYVFHVVGIRLLGIEELPGAPLHTLLGFIVAVTVLATLWRRPPGCSARGRPSRRSTRSGRAMAYGASRDGCSPPAEMWVRCARTLRECAPYVVAFEYARR